MEIRANYTLIGAFTLLSFLGIILFTLWLAKLDQVELVEYDILFEEKVEGLNINSEVLFNGIRVGSVTKLTLDAKNPSIVKARIAIAEGTPVREDSVATLSAKGLTGLMLISIAGGSSDAHYNVPQEDEIGSINYAPSPLATITTTLPQTMEAVNNLLKSINSIVGEESKENINIILTNFAEVSATLGSRKENIDNILMGLEMTTKEMQSLATSANKMVTSLEKTLKTIEPNVAQFSREGLPELRMLLVEARNFVQTFTRIGQKFESNPRFFLFGEPVREHQVPR